MKDIIENCNEDLSKLSKKDLINKITEYKSECENLAREVDKYMYYAFCDTMTTAECQKVNKDICIYNRTYWEIVYREEHKYDECDFYLIDINNLKIVNDTQGHKYGDKHICNCVKILAPYGKVFRLGGDEFILIPDKDKEEAFKEYLNKQGYLLNFAYGYFHKMPKNTFFQVMKTTDNEMYKFKNTQKSLKRGKSA